MSHHVPRHFQFGVAESDLQSVGFTIPYEQEHSHMPLWNSFAVQQGIEPPAFGSYKYGHWKEDVDLIGNLGVQAYRTSISMSRTTDRNGDVNMKAIAWYREYLRALKDRGLIIHAALYHWEIPEHFGEQGILHPDFPAFFLRHVDIVLEHLSDLIDYYIPVNEQWCVAFLSCYVGIHAPGKKDMKSFFATYFKMLEIQSQVIRKIAAHDPQHKIGIVNIHFPAYTLPDFNGNSEHERIRHIADHLTNYMYADPYFFGTLNEQLVEEYKQHFPLGFEKIVANAKVAEHIYYYGVNFYTSMYVVPADNPLGYDQRIPDGAHTNQLGWPISIPPQYPEGLTDMLVNIHKRYAVKRLYVSENGVPGRVHARDAQGVPMDTFRIEFIAEHLKQVQKAIAQGAPVDGYFLWSITDNYEWQEAYKPESAFGLVAVDFSSGRRTPKQSYYWYQSYIHEFVYGKT